MTEPLVSPFTGNPIVGSPSSGYTDTVTNQFIPSDLIDGSASETWSPLDFIGGVGSLGRLLVGKLLAEGGEDAAGVAAAKLLAKKAAKKEGCPTCSGTTDAKLIKKADDAADSSKFDGTTFRGDARSPDEIQSAGGFNAQDPNANLSLDQHMAAGRDPSQWVSTSTDPEAASWYGANPNASPGQGGGWVYQIEQPGGVSVPATSIGNASGNSEVAFSNSIPWSNVSSYAQVPEGAGPTSMGMSGAPTSWTPNPSFVPK